MTSDDFLAGLRDGWHQVPVDLERVRRLTLRRRLWQVIRGPISLAGTVCAFLLALWFGWRAFVLDDPLSAVGGIALFVTAPVLLLEYFEGRRSNRVRYDDTPHGVLLQARRQLDFSRRLQLGCRLAALILGSAAVAAFLLGELGASSPRRAFTTALTWGVTAGAVWLWAMWRRRRLDREAATCERLLAEIGGEEAS